MAEVSVKLLQSWVGRERIIIEKVATGAAVIIWDPLQRKAASTHLFITDEAKLEEKLKELLSQLNIGDDSSLQRVRVKIAGGADVAGLQIGKKFVNILINVIKKLKIPVGGYDLGGNVTRTVVFDPVTGKCTVHFLVGGTREI